MKIWHNVSEWITKRTQRLEFFKLCHRIFFLPARR